MKKVLSAYDGNLKLAELIRAGKPFAAVRYGGTELSGCCAGKEFMIGLKKQLPQQIADNLQRQSGFFPNDPSLLPRFNDWFEALDYMVEEALKIPFDIALIGCGAYW